MLYACSKQCTHISARAKHSVRLSSSTLHRILHGWRIEIIHSCYARNLRSSVSQHVVPLWKSIISQELEKRNQQADLDCMIASAGDSQRVRQMCRKCFYTYEKVLKAQAVIESNAVKAVALLSSAGASQSPSKRHTQPPCLHALQVLLDIACRRQKAGKQNREFSQSQWATYRTHHARATRQLRSVAVWVSKFHIPVLHDLGSNTFNVQANRVIRCHDLHTFAIYIGNRYVQTYIDRKYRGDESSGRV